MFWMTMLNRSAPAAPPDVVLTKPEIELLDHRVKDKENGACRNTPSHYLTKIAKLGGYLARANVPPQGILSCGADYRA
jgi:hypothetical protein